MCTVDFVALEIQYYFLVKQFFLLILFEYFLLSNNRTQSFNPTLGAERVFITKWFCPSATVRLVFIDRLITSTVVAMRIGLTKEVLHILLLTVYNCIKLATLHWSHSAIVSFLNFKVNCTFFVRPVTLAIVLHFLPNSGKTVLFGAKGTRSRIRSVPAACSSNRYRTDGVWCVLRLRFFPFIYYYPTLPYIYLKN